MGTATGFCFTPINVVITYNLTFNWYGAHLERLQIFMPNDVKFVQQFHDLFTDICRIVGDGRSLQGSLKPKTRKI